MPLRDCEVAVIGAGVAGCTAALYARRFGLDTIVLERAAPGGQTATAAYIENYPGFPEGISGLELAQAVMQQAKKFGAECLAGEIMGISRADDGRWTLHTDQGDMRAIAVIVATGAQPRKLGVPGEDEFSGRGVSYCATCDGFFFRGQTVAVVGGGNTAVDEAIFLSDICERVYLIHRRDRLRAEKYLEDRARAKSNIEFVWNSIVIEIRGQETVESVRIRNVQSGEDTVLAVQGVFVAIGHAPKTDWLCGCVETRDGFIVTNERMETSAPGIFAAGDVRDTLVRQITTAVGDATVAAYFAYHYVDKFKAERGGG